MHEQRDFVEYGATASAVLQDELDEKNCFDASCCESHHSIRYSASSILLSSWGHAHIPAFAALKDHTQVLHESSFTPSRDDTIYVGADSTSLQLPKVSRLLTRE